MVRDVTSHVTQQNTSENGLAVSTELCTEENVDEQLRKLEQRVQKFQNARNSRVRRSSAEGDLLISAGELRDLLRSTVEQNKESLFAVFGDGQRVNKLNEMREKVNLSEVHVDSTAGSPRHGAWQDLHDIVDLVKALMQERISPRRSQNVSRTESDQSENKKSESSPSGNSGGEERSSVQAPEETWDLDVLEYEGGEVHSFHMYKDCTIGPANSGLRDKGAEFSIEPELPPGLSINPVTGVITGNVKMTSSTIVDHKVKYKVTAKMKLSDLSQKLHEVSTELEIQVLNPWQYCPSQC